MSAETSKGGDDRAMELTNMLDLRMRGETGAIAAVTDAVSDKLIHLDVPEEKRLEIALAVQEALANAVVHGCKNDPSMEVRCRLERDSNGRILITVTDPGDGFHPEALSNPKHWENLHAGHGRGVYLIRQLMDEVYFATGGNEIRMWKY
jgi:serine/threonine-protein kinase RsbW